MIKHIFSVMTMLKDECGGVKDRDCWGDHEKDPTNRLTDISFHALSGVEIIISQQVELSTVTFAPLKCPWARYSILPAPEAVLFSLICALTSVLRAPKKKNHPVINSSIYNADYVVIIKATSAWLSRDPKWIPGLLMAPPFTWLLVCFNETGSYGEARVNSLLATLKT